MRPRTLVHLRDVDWDVFPLVNRGNRDQPIFRCVWKYERIHHNTTFNQENNAIIVPNIQPSCQSLYWSILSIRSNEKIETFTVQWSNRCEMMLLDASFSLWTWVFGHLLMEFLFCTCRLSIIITRHRIRRRCLAVALFWLSTSDRSLMVLKWIWYKKTAWNARSKFGAYLKNVRNLVHVLFKRLLLDFNYGRFFIIDWIGDVGIMNRLFCS